MIKIQKYTLAQYRTYIKMYLDYNIFNALLTQRFKGSKKL